jgi:hypothetical protein
MKLQDAISEFKTALLGGSYPSQHILNALQQYREKMPNEVQQTVHQMTRSAFPNSGAPSLYSQAVYRLRVSRAQRGG